MTEDQFEFIMNNGGTPLVRRLIFYQYTKRKPEDHLVRSYDMEDRSNYTARTSIRLYSSLETFVKQKGGATYVRALIQSFMEYKHSTEIKIE